MSSLVRRFLVSVSAVVLVSSALAISPHDINELARAQSLITKVLKVVETYHASSVVLTAPAPIKGTTGQYLLPYRADGEITEWAGKIVNVTAGKLVGEKVGDKATDAVASRVPFGGLAGGLIKKKSKEFTTQAFLGGPEYIKKTSDISFANLNDYAVYLHAKHANAGNYQQALAAAMALYPDLENTFEGAIKEAYRAQSAAAAHPAPAAAATKG